MVLLVFGFCFTANAQYKVKDGITVYKGDYGGVRIHIKAISENKITNVVMNQKKVESVHKILLKIRERFKQWQEIAKRDTVKYVDKEFRDDYGFVCNASWTNGGEWWLAYTIGMKPYFRVDNGVGWISIRPYRTPTASTNQFIKLRSTNWV